MNNITFEDAVATLKTMFPDWDEETLTTILVSNDYHVERTIENVLSMCGDTTVGPPAGAAQPSTDRLSMNPSPSRSMSNESREPGAAPAPAAAESRYRGRMCSLPDDFLRPPGYSPRIIADEELALMLQNELFRREAQMLLGEDFGSSGRSGGAGSNRFYQPGKLPRRDSRPESNTAPSSSAAGGTASDLGILKSLNSMGGAAKRNLSQLAERFSQSNKASNNRRPAEGPGREFKQLGDEEDDFEIINFDSKNQSRTKHRLQDGSHDDDDFACRNPMLASNNPGPGGSASKQTNMVNKDAK